MNPIEELSSLIGIVQKSSRSLSAVTQKESAKEETNQKQPLKLKLGIFNNNDDISLFHSHYNEATFDEKVIELSGANNGQINTLSNLIHLNDRTVELTISDATPSVESIAIICTDAKAVVFTFDLLDESTLSSIYSYYRKARDHNMV